MAKSDDLRKAIQDYNENTPQFQATLRDFVTHERARGNNLSMDEAKNSQKFQAVTRALYSDDNRSTGRKAAALVILGRRNREDDWNVGESPPKE